jgi:hypothetical protein
MFLGQPTTVGIAMSRKPETAVQTRFDDLLFDRMQAWRRAQRRIPPLADTVRKLVERGLDAEASRHNEALEEVQREQAAIKADAAEA